MKAEGWGWKNVETEKLVRYILGMFLLMFLHIELKMLNSNLQTTCEAGSGACLMGDFSTWTLPGWIKLAREYVKKEERTILNSGDTSQEPRWWSWYSKLEKTMLSGQEAK